MTVAGISYRHAHRAALLAGAPRQILLEVVPDHFFADPGALAPLAERYPIVFHDTAMSLASAGDATLGKARLGRIAALAKIARPILFGDHLAMTRAPSGIELGHLAPVWLVPEVLELVCDRVRALADVLGVPVVVETIAAPLALPGATMTEPEFFTELVARTGCGMLLDITNTRSGSHAARDYPLAAVRQIHLAGGFRDRDARWIDSHDAPVDDDAYAQLRAIAAATKGVRAIVVERDGKLPPLDELAAEAARAARIWEEAHA